MLWLHGGHPPCIATSTSLLLAWVPQRPRRALTAPSRDARRWPRSQGQAARSGCAGGPLPVEVIPQAGGPELCLHILLRWASSVPRCSPVSPSASTGSNQSRGHGFMAQGSFFPIFCKSSSQWQGQLPVQLARGHAGLSPGPVPCPLSPLLAGCLMTDLSKRVERVLRRSSLSWPTNAHAVLRRRGGW